MQLVKALRGSVSRERYGQVYMVFKTAIANHHKTDSLQQEEWIFSLLEGQKLRLKASIGLC